VSYGNAHGAKDFEDDMPIEASFAWRLLHLLFIERNGKTSKDVAFWSSKEFLPANAATLTLRTALETVRIAAQRFGYVLPHETLSLFVGIDECQDVPKGPKNTFLSQLIAALDECQTICGIHLYVALAGTECSVPGTVQVPLCLLSHSGAEDMVRSDVRLRALLDDSVFRRQLFFLGGIPRPSVLFALGRRTFQELWHQYVECKWRFGHGALTQSETLHLIAVAVSGETVDAREHSGIKNATWQRLFDRGVCFHQADRRIGIPYCLFRLAAQDVIEVATTQRKAEVCLLQNLRFLSHTIDSALFNSEQCQVWESFGACFFAMRVNALLLLRGEKTSVPFSALLCGAVVNGCDTVVKLAPVQVHSIREELDSDLQSIVSDSGTKNRQFNWMVGDSGVRYSLLNHQGEGKSSVGFFSALEIDADSGGLLFYTDQRRLPESQLLDSFCLVIPACLPEQSKVVRGLFSIANNNNAVSVIPTDSFLVTSTHLAASYGTLASHPACNPFVNRLTNRSSL
jgi:hypothetical protein